MVYRNDLKSSERRVVANSVDPDQTTTKGTSWSGSTLFAILPASFGCITLICQKKKHIVQILG